MSIFRTLLLSVSFLLIYSCGGGGGGGGSAPAPAPVPPPTYIISEGNIYSTSIPSLLYIDENMNSLRDSYEKTTTPGSDGSFSFSTTNSGEVSCLKKQAILSENPLSFSHNPSEGSNVKINAFTTLFSDGQFIYARSPNPIDPSRLASDDDCSNYEQYKLQSERVFWRHQTARMEKYDNQTFEQISSNPTSPAVGSVITASRQRDLENFYVSIGSIERAVNTELQNLIAANAPGLNVSLKTRTELDMSNLRIFLNGSGYPNPSTDPSPVANSIDSIAAMAGLAIYASTPNYSGAYTNSYEVVITDIKISNAGKILQDNESCYINFSSLCLVEPTFRNAIAYSSEPVMRDALHKTTARGVETFSSQENITNSSTLACNDSNYINLTDTSLPNVTRTYEYGEFLGTGTFNVEDLSCYVTNANKDSHLGIINRYNDGSGETVALFYTRNQSEPGIARNFPESINYYNYDEIDTPPEQIPQSYVDAFLALGSGGWDTVDKVLTQETRNTADTLWSNGMLMMFSFYSRDQRRLGLVFADFGITKVGIYCFPVDGESVSQSVPYKDGETIAELASATLDVCRNQMTSTYEPISEIDPIKNMSPYRGVIDD